MDGEEAIEFGLLSKQIESAQKRVEGRNYDIRRHVLQYDDVMNQQREIIYGQRREVLSGARRARPDPEDGRRADRAGHRRALLGAQHS